MSLSNPLKISAIICTYNRAKLLVGALESLVQQSLDPRCYEIIVVDNASTDDTPEVVRAFHDSYPEHNIVWIYEPQQGLGHARNAGLKCANGRYIAYLDDDARVSPDWLKNALHLFAAVEPMPICVGGPILPFYEAPKPEWFKDKYEIRTWGDKPRFLRRGETFSGSNMVWRKEAAESLGGFDVGLGVKGDYLSLGEERVLFNKAWHSLDQPIFYYSPQLSVLHLVTPQKMTISYRLKREFVYGQVWNQLRGPKAFWGRMLLLVRLLWGIARAGSLALWQGRTQSHWQSWVVENWKPVVRKIGILSGILGLTFAIRQR
jgi:glycosyltransferase involved in cell wall biosynthesis